MNPRTNALWMITMMLAVGLADPASAWHSVPEKEDLGLEDPPSNWHVGDVGVGVQPVDRRLDDGAEAANDANRTYHDAYYSIVGTTLNTVDNTTGSAQQNPITLLRDGAGGRQADRTDDLLDGGFGDPALSMGNFAWNHSRDAAATGQEGYATPKNPGGTGYPAFAQSLLVTPEIDLGADQFMEGQTRDSARSSVDAANEGADEAYRPGRDAYGSARDAYGPAHAELSNEAREACVTLYGADEIANNTLNETGSGDCPVPIPPLPEIPEEIDDVDTPSIPSDVPSMAYYAAYGACTDYEPFQPIIEGFLGLPPAVSLLCSDPHDALDKDITLEFRNRHNLALNRDGVAIMVFTQPPTMEAAAACSQGRYSSGAAALATEAIGQEGLEPPNPQEGELPEEPPLTPCRIVRPTSAATGDNAYRAGGLGSTPHGMGYTGYRDWNTDAIDLTPWSGRSVWVGFYFGSGATGGSSYFQDASQFNPAAPFHGFHMDDIVVKSLAAQVNVVARPMERPSCRVDLCLDGMPILDPAEPTDVVISVMNHGAQEVDIRTVTRILALPNRTVVHTFDMVDGTLPPGAYMQRSLQVDGLEQGVYIVQTCAVRNGPGTAGDTDFCDNPLPADACSGDPLEADPCRRVSERRFGLVPIDALRLDPIRVGSTSIGRSDQMTATLTIHNDGNSDQTVQVDALHVDLEKGTTGDFLLPDTQVGARTVVVPQQGSTDVQWDIGGTSGEYRMVGQVYSVDGDPRPVRVKYDLLPPLLRPLDSVPFTDDNITIDGLFEDGAWFDSSPRLLGDSGTSVQVGNNATHMFMALRNLPPADEFTLVNGSWVKLPVPVGLFFNDFDDADVSSGGGGFGFTFIPDDVTTEYQYNQSSASWDAIHQSPWWEAPAADRIAARWADNPDPQADPDSWQLELRIPIDRDTPGTINAGPGEALGMLLRYCGHLDRDLGCDTFPVRAPLTDGSGFHARDGDLDDEVQQWHPILLADPADDPAFAANALSPAFAIGRGAPPTIFLEDFQKCPALRGWEHELQQESIFQGVQDKWNCSGYTEDGRSLLYVGMSPGSDCGAGTPCPPYTGILFGPIPSIPDRSWKLDERGYQSRLNHSFRTPPIPVPMNAQDPTVLLSHQYSTEVSIEDRYFPGVPLFGGGFLPSSQGRIRVSHMFHVEAETWNEETSTWEHRGALLPTGGFPTEASTGILDPRYPPRQFYQDPACVRYGQFEPILEGSVIRCGFVDRQDSWWWPQGEQATYRPLDRDIPVPGGATFHGGSPWTTDRIPLVGSTVDGTPLDLRGETVRLRFIASASPAADRTHAPDLKDWGWRIGGLAVIEGDALPDDLSVMSARVAVSFDPFELGIGPNTTVPVEVEVHNGGREEASNVRVRVVGEDQSLPPSHTDFQVCSSQQSGKEDNGKVKGTIPPGQSRTVTILCKLDPAHTSGRLALRGWVERAVPGDEDFLGNDNFRVRGHFDIRESRDLTIAVLDVVPSSGVVGQERSIPIRVRNDGNVPVDGGVVVTLKVLGTDPVTGLPVELESRQWTTDESVSLDSVMSLEDLVGDLGARPKYTSHDTGRFVAQVTIQVPGTSIQDRAVAVFQTVGDVYLQSFDNAAPTVDEDIMDGALHIQDPHIWGIQKTGGVGGSTRLVAGDPTNGEIPPGSNGSVILPEIDLRLLADSTLSFKHRYDLEPGYDAARVEVSVDGGRTWQPMQPRSQPGNGLPEGYSSTSLVGANAILGDDVECFGCAYMGRSDDLPGAEDGWVDAEFAIGDQSAFLVDATLERFTLDGMASRPDPDPVFTTDGPAFFHDSWVIDGLEGTGQRYWWIDNQTYSRPDPITDNRMWWSGASSVVPGAGVPPSSVDTSLEFQVAKPGDWTTGDQLVLRFWDWRAGWEASADGGRFGTGGRFLVDPLMAGLDHQPATIVERRHDGWTLREVDLTEFVAASDAFGVNFTYISGGGRAETQNNRGWFIDSVQFVRVEPDGGETNLFHNTASDTSSGHRSVQAGDTQWSSIRQGATAHDGGWHIRVEEVPGQGDVPVWRLQDDRAVEGYPANVDSRVVAPTIDLRTYPGDSAALTFQHRYSFFENERLIFPTAWDSGVIEVQVLDETTGRYGPWRPVPSATGQDPEFGFSGTTEPLRVEDPVQRPQLQTLNPPSLMFSQAPSEGGPYDPHVQPDDIRLTKLDDASGAGMVGMGRDLDARYTNPKNSFGHPLPIPHFITWIDRIGNGYSADDDVYLRTNDGYLRLTDVHYPDHPQEGKNTSYDAGTWVQECDAEDWSDECEWNNENNNVTFESAFTPVYQWVDQNGDGAWSHHDMAYIPFNEDGVPAEARNVAAGHVRLNRLDAAHPGSTIVAPGDPDVDAPLQPDGGFTLCITGDNPPHHYYVSSVLDCWAIFVRPPAPGAPFMPSQGWFSELSSKRGSQLKPMLPYNYTPVYSGNSGGWVQETLDITPFIGEQVRFGFHAWTNPSERPCSHSNCKERFGWAISDVQVQGQQFQGQPALIRFHVATDDSMPKGQWSIDDIQVLGQKIDKAVVFRSDQTSVLESPGADVELGGTVVNLGNGERSGLALAVEVRDATTGDPLDGGDWQIMQPTGLARVDPATLPPGFDGVQAHGPFRLGPGGSDDGGLPVQLQVRLPDDDGVVEARITVLEDVGECTTIDNETTCETRYAEVNNGRGAGLPSAFWRVEGREVTDLRFTPPLADRVAELVADPPVPQRDEDTGWQPVTVHASIANHGTTTPDSGLTAEWTFTHVERKGDPDSQRWTRQEEQAIRTEPQPLPAIARGEEWPVQAAFTPTGPGLYRADVQILLDGEVQDQASLEVWAGELDPYYGIDFAKDDAASNDWQDTQPQGPQAYGQSPAEVAFRQEAGRFIWGVNQTQFIAGQNYCTVSSSNPCNPPPGTSGNPPPIYGLHGIAEGPRVDLGRVVGGEVTLSLRHGNVFTEHDGAVVEALPLRHPTNPDFPQPAFACEAGSDAAPMWFRLHADATTPLQGSDSGYPRVQIHTGPPVNGKYPTGWTPERVNPVDLDGDGPFIWDPLGVEQETTRFLLTDPVPVCPPGYSASGENTLPPTLVNYTVQLRLRAGTTPGLNEPLCTQFNNGNRCLGHDETRNPPTRTGAMGWQVDRIGIASVDVQIHPEERTLPLLDGFKKRFNIQVTNDGPVPDTFHVGLAGDAASVINTTWFTFPVPEVELHPGQTKTVPFEVLIPGGSFGAGIPVTHIQATSSLDPNIFDRVRIQLVLPENPLPDLWAGLDIQVDTDDPHPGKVVRVVTTTHNLGSRGSDPVPVVIEATLLDGDGNDITTTPIATKNLDRLDPDQVQVHVSEWVPKQAGTYRIVAVADPEGKLIDPNTANNRAETTVAVLPEDRAKVRFTDLTFDGVGDDGWALEGSLIIINATFRNEGHATATGGRVFIWAGSTQLLEVKLGALSPGDTGTVAALRVASPGETKVRAIYIPTSGQEDPHELSRILRVRGLDLSYEAPTDPLPFTPGDTATTQVNITNGGNAVEKVVFTLGPDHEGWALAATPNPVTIAPQGGTAWSILTLQAPDDAVAGDYDVFVLAAPQSRPDVPQHIAVPVHVASDLQAPTMQVGNATGTPGAMAVPVTLQSTSNAPQDMQIFTDPVDWLPQPHNLTLLPGALTAIDLAVQVPGTTPPGNQTLNVIVKDLDNSTLTMDETTIHVLPKENGTAAWGSNRTSRTVDLTSREFSIDLDFTNTGNVPVRPYVSLSSLTAGAETVPTDVESMDLVAPGAMVQLPVSVRVDQEFGGAVTGQAAVFMQVASEADNAYKDVLVTQLAIPDLGYLPDLAVKDVSFSPRGVVDAGDPVHIEVTFENLGRAATPNTDLYAYVNGEAVNVYDVQPLAPGETVQLNLTWAFPASGEYLVHLVADGDGRVTELHDDNNGWTQDMTVEPGSLFQQAKEAPGPAWPFVVLVLLAACLVTRQRRP